MRNNNDKGNTALRFDIIVAVIFLVFAALTARMFKLTIIDGEKYRDVADKRRMRRVYETAPRGEIRDRHGRLLAGNVPSFTVQILKDELLSDKLDAKKRNDNLLKLIRLLEEDGAFYQGEFPMDLNMYVYSDLNYYLTNEDSPTDYMINKLNDDSVLKEFIEGRMNLERYKNHYKFSVKNRVLNAIREKYVDIPVTLEGDVMTADSAKLTSFLKEKGMDESLSADELIFEIIKSDRSLKAKVLNHPIARAILFKIVGDRGSLGEIRMNTVSVKYDIEAIEDKVSLIHRFPDLSFDTTAEEAYLYIVTKNALTDMLKKNYKSREIIPGEILLKSLQDEGKLKNIEIYLSEDEESVFYKYVGESNDKDAVKDIIGSATPAELKSFLLDDRIRPIAQLELLNKGINPKISVAKEIQFSSELNRKNLYGRFFKEDELKNGYPSSDELFERVKQKYEIDSELSPYEAKGILNVYELAYKMGESAYRPFNLSYGIKDGTVAKIEEGIDGDTGIRVSIEPVRYYPMGMNSCHILGYMGKISSDAELEKYVNGNGYDKNEFIGKTGVEEAFEYYLHGKGGEKMVEVDYVGNTSKVMSEKKPVPGNTVYLTIDSKLQDLAEKSLERTIRLTRTSGVWTSKWGDYTLEGELVTKRPFTNCNAGAVVAINAKTGELLAMASYPGYDPNLFSTGISQTDWESLFPENDDDPLAARPLYNIATQTAVQPGSTFKMLTGYAGLLKGLNPFEKIYDGGYVEIGDTKFRCLAYTLGGRSHGYVDLAHAIEHSCNYYFYSLALGYNQRQNETPISAKVEIEDILEAGRIFGLNSATGLEINTPKEVIGGVPEPEKKIVTTKFYMKKFMQASLKDFLKVEKDDTEIEEDINTIANWAEEGRALTKTELVKRLDLMGYEAEANVPNHRRSLSDVLKYDYINQAGWTLSDTLNVTIGQGASRFTPIQMARYIATIANGGIKNKVTLLDSVKTYDKSEEIYKPEVIREQVDITDKAGFNELKHGMRLVSTSGTSKRIFEGFPIATGSKTGTAQREGINPVTGKGYDDFGWFVSYAPYDDPEIVVAAVLFQGGHGSNAGPMARDIMAEYLGLNREEIKNQMPFKNGITE